MEAGLPLYRLKLKRSSRVFGIPLGPHDRWGSPKVSTVLATNRAGQPSSGSRECVGDLNRRSRVWGHGVVGAATPPSAPVGTGGVAGAACVAGAGAATVPSTGATG